MHTRQSITNLLLLSCALALPAAGAHARDTVRGSITVEFDGKTQQFDITTLANTSRASAGMVTDEGPMPSLTLWGAASAKTPGATGSFKLDLSYAKPLSPKSRLHSAQATWMTKGIAPPFWVSTEDVKVTLTEARFDGKTGRIEGHFKGQLCLREKASLPPDTKQCKPVEGRFASDLAKEEL